MNSLLGDVASLARVLVKYFRHKVIFAAHGLESWKNFAVDQLMSRRGILQKKVWHGSMVALSVVGILTSGAFGGQTIISSSFPGIGGEDPRFAQTFEPSANAPVLNSLYDTRTNISQKPRSEIINYQIKDGDTLSNIADKFDISTDTIRWANNLQGDSIKPGDTLRILPVSGVAHTVVSGDTLQSVAKKYSADSQAILDFPFNDIPDDFALKIGQVLIIPNGIPPSQLPSVKLAPQPSAPAYSSENSPTFSAPGGGNFIWPTHGIITQYFSWYHPADDIANPAAPPITASDGGVVVVAGWPDNFGYGNRVVIDHGNSYSTLYAHLSNIYVTVGQRISRGQIIGQMGSTGRSTGTHLHFEIRFKGIALNPLTILK